MNEKIVSRIIGGLELLTGAGIIIAGATIPELKESAIINYIGGSLLVIDGAADLISGRVGYLIGKFADMGDNTTYMKESKNNKEGED